MNTPVALASGGKQCYRPARLGRGIPDITEHQTKKCVCRREKTIVFCRLCGYFCNGRIRRKCVKHSRVTFLLDLTECPRCHSSVYLDEYVEK